MLILIFYSVFVDIDTEYGNITKIAITRVNLHKYLGMTIHYSLPGKVIFYMVYYIGMILYDISEDMRGKSTTPVANHIFDIAEDATKLSLTNVDIFHHFVAQILYPTGSSSTCPLFLHALSF